MERDGNATWLLQDSGLHRREHVLVTSFRVRLIPELGERSLQSPDRAPLREPVDHAQAAANPDGEVDAYTHGEAEVSVLTRYDSGEWNEAEAQQINHTNSTNYHEQCE